MLTVWMESMHRIRHFSYHFSALREYRFWVLYTRGGRCFTVLYYNLIWWHRNSLPLLPPRFITPLSRQDTHPSRYTYHQIIANMGRYVHHPLQHPKTHGANIEQNALERKRYLGIRPTIQTYSAILVKGYPRGCL
jgi:hypothetical protein